ncbi:MAG: DNA starvation/stationary phase protection protein [Epulopiscium sp. Nele67-Bin002]|nr:MAG: DNA starvation/stationary phase protection protein [Epulopiscium sp. Nuni2H_MBin001]OON92264.1 MAG: DNA starvation/stationary phase protection protein [Epulopiscium sp. Nele67-Bin002]OON92312.1 MAG: DNA starvation/stationary phase protection protein [Epulopiscium sp. Nele67-Bin001]
MDKLTALNTQLANWSVLYVKLHKFHWYVQGPEFFTLHTKFEEFYEDATAFTDEIAERILTIGEKPLATMKDYLESSQIKECCCTSATGKEMVQALVADYETIVTSSREIIASCEGSDDETADLFRGKIGELEKTLWMLKAYLG